MKAHKVISPDKQLWYGTFKTKSDAMKHMETAYPNDVYEIIEVISSFEEERKEAWNEALDKAFEVVTNRFGRSEIIKGELEKLKV